MVEDTKTRPAKAEVIANLIVGDLVGKIWDGVSEQEANERFGGVSEYFEKEVRSRVRACLSVGSSIFRFLFPNLAVGFGTMHDQVLCDPSSNYVEGVSECEVAGVEGAPMTRFVAFV